MVFKKNYRMALVAGSILTGGLILFSFLGPWISLADSLAHFRFHLTALITLASVLLALSRAWQQAGLAAAVAVAGIAGMAPAFPAWNATGVDGKAPAITMVQLNLSFRNSRPGAVADFIRAENADIVTLQEVTDKTSKVMGLLAEDYPFQIRCDARRVGGPAIMSRLPMAPGAAKGCIKGQGMAWMQVMAGGRPVSVASLHLHWPYPFAQSDQIDRLESHLKQLPRPVLLAGDFNAAPWSHAVKRIAQATDTDVAAGLRFSFDIRFNRWIPPIAIPIDHILLPEGLAPLDVRLGPGPGSDHLSVVARISLPAALSDEPSDRAQAPSGDADAKVN